MMQQILEDKTDNGGHRRYWRIQEKMEDIGDIIGDIEGYRRYWRIQEILLVILEDMEDIGDIIGDIGGYRK